MATVPTSGGSGSIRGKKPGSDPLTASSRARATIIRTGRLAAPVSNTGTGKGGDAPEAEEAPLGGSALPKLSEQHVQKTAPRQLPMTPCDEPNWLLDQLWQAGKAYEHEFKEVQFNASMAIYVNEAASFFRKLDRSGDGSLSVLEIICGLESLHLPFSNHELHSFLGHFETNEEGEVGAQEVANFLNYARDNCQFPPTPWVPELPMTTIELKEGNPDKWYFLNKDKHVKIRSGERWLNWKTIEEQFVREQKMSKPAGAPSMVNLYAAIEAEQIDRRKRFGAADSKQIEPEHKFCTLIWKDRSGKVKTDFINRKTFRELALKRPMDRRNIISLQSFCRMDGALKKSNSLFKAVYRFYDGKGTWPHNSNEEATSPAAGDAADSSWTEKEKEAHSSKYPPIGASVTVDRCFDHWLVDLFSNTEKIRTSERLPGDTELCTHIRREVMACVKYLERQQEVKIFELGVDFVVETLETYRTRVYAVRTFAVNLEPTPGINEAKRAAQLDKERKGSGILDPVHTKWCRGDYCLFLPAHWRGEEQTVVELAGLNRLDPGQKLTAAMQKSMRRNVVLKDVIQHDRMERAALQDVDANQRTLLFSDSLKADALIDNGKVHSFPIKVSAPGHLEGNAVSLHLTFRGPTSSKILLSLQTPSGTVGPAYPHKSTNDSHVVESMSAHNLIVKLESGEKLQGTWTLMVQDVYLLHQGGTLVSWGFDVLVRTHVHPLRENFNTYMEEFCGGKFDLPRACPKIDHVNNPWNKRSNPWQTFGRAEPHILDVAAKQLPVCDRCFKIYNKLEKERKAVEDEILQVKDQQDGFDPDRTFIGNGLHSPIRRKGKGKKGSRSRSSTGTGTSTLGESSKARDSRLLGLSRQSYGRSGAISAPPQFDLGASDKISTEHGGGDGDEDSLNVTSVSAIAAAESTPVRSPLLPKDWVDDGKPFNIISSGKPIIHKVHSLAHVQPEALRAQAKKEKEEKEAAEREAATKENARSSLHIQTTKQPRMDGSIHDLILSPGSRWANDFAEVRGELHDPLPGQKSIFGQREVHSVDSVQWSTPKIIKQAGDWDVPDVAQVHLPYLREAGEPQFNPTQSPLYQLKHANSIVHKVPLPDAEGADGTGVVHTTSPHSPVRGMMSPVRLPGQTQAMSKPVWPSSAMAQAVDADEGADMQTVVSCIASQMVTFALVGAGIENATDRNIIPPHVLSQTLPSQPVLAATPSNINNVNADMLEGAAHQWRGSVQAIVLEIVDAALRASGVEMEPVSAPSVEPHWSEAVDRQRDQAVTEAKSKHLDVVAESAKVEPHWSDAIDRQKSAVAKADAEAEDAVGEKKTEKEQAADVRAMYEVQLAERSHAEAASAKEAAEERGAEELKQAAERRSPPPGWQRSADAKDEVTVAYSSAVAAANASSVPITVNPGITSPPLPNIGHAPPGSLLSSGHARIGSAASSKLSSSGAVTIEGTMGQALDNSHIADGGMSDDTPVSAMLADAVWGPERPWTTHLSLYLQGGEGQPEAVDGGRDSDGEFEASLGQRPSSQLDGRTLVRLGAAEHFAADGHADADPPHQGQSLQAPRGARPTNAVPPSLRQLPPLPDREGRAVELDDHSIYRKERVMQRQLAGDKTTKERKKFRAVERGPDVVRDEIETRLKEAMSMAPLQNVEGQLAHAIGMSPQTRGLLLGLGAQVGAGAATEEEAENVAGMLESSGDIGALRVNPDTMERVRWTPVKDSRPLRTKPHEAGPGKSKANKTQSKKTGSKGGPKERKTWKGKSGAAARK